ARRSVRDVTRRALGGLAAALLATGLSFSTGWATAPSADGLMAGAAPRPVKVPDGTPLRGYRGVPRRPLVPGVFGRWPHAFWLRPSTGVHDPLVARTLLLQRGAIRVLWIAADLVGTDPTLVTELAALLAREGLGYSAIILSASHTHSGPGA